MSSRFLVCVAITLMTLSALITRVPKNSYALDNSGSLGNPGFEDGAVPTEKTWTRPFDPVDPTGGLYTSLALDPFDNTPHISYYSNGDLKYATLSGGVWIIETVDSVGDVGLYTSIALEPRGVLSPDIHISYYDRTNGDLKYVTKSGATGAWTTLILDGDISTTAICDSTSLVCGGTLGDVGLYTSITLDILGNVYVSYYAEHAEEIRLAYTGERIDPSFWQVERGPQARVGGESTSIVLDLLFMNPIIAYFDLNCQFLKLAMYDRADAFGFPIVDNPYPDWGVEIVGSGSAFVEDISLALDSGGEPHISYSDAGYTLTGALKTDVWYVKKECLGMGCMSQPTSTQPTGEGTWNFEVVDSLDPVRGHTSIAVDSSRDPHISYSGLRHASKSDGVWTIDIVDSGAEVGLFTSITRDADDNPHISYYDALNDELKYVRGSPPTAPIDPWQFGLNPVVAQSIIVHSGSFAAAMPSSASLFQDISPPACAQSIRVFGKGYGHVALRVDYSGGSPHVQQVTLPTTPDVWGETMINLDHTRLVRRVTVVTGAVNPIPSLGTVVGADGHTPIPLGIVLDDFELVLLEPCPTVSVASATGVGDVTFSTSSGQFQSLTAISEADLPSDAGKPTGVIFPFGFFSWTISNLALGETVTITITFPSNVPSPSQYWKVISNVWTDVSSLIGDDDDDCVLTITITDGGLGDADGEVNGEISDPGGVAITHAPEPPSYWVLVIGGIIVFVLVLAHMAFRYRKKRLPQPS
nr:choice-of-anchor U domain-containing protein [Candidatus Njordarchaeum guaymaensis]